MDRTFEYAVRVVRLCRYLEGRKVPRAMVGQLLRSATSVGANTVESQGGQSRADFLSKLSIALKECNESVYWLRLLVAADLTSAAKTCKLQSEGEDIAKVLASIIVSARKNSR